MSGRLRPGAARTRIPLASLVALLGASCGGGSSSHTPVRVYPDASPALLPQVSVAAASLSEGFVGGADPYLHVDLTVTNPGAVPIDAFAVQEGQLVVSGGIVNLDFALDLGSDDGPIDPGETRHLAISAGPLNLGLCTTDLLLEPNPHQDLATLGLTFLTSAGAVVLSEVEVAVTCEVPPGEVLACPRRLADACAETDDQGRPLFRCTPQIDDVPLDTYYCGTGAADYTESCSQGLTARVVVLDGMVRVYLYDGALIAVTTSGPSGPECLAGPIVPMLAPDCPSYGLTEAGAPLAEQPACTGPDGGAPADAAPEAGAPDGGAPDGGAPDGGVTDGGVTDGGVTDGGVTDGGAADGAALDGGASDDAAPDAIAAFGSGR